MAASGPASTSADERGDGEDARIEFLAAVIGDGRALELAAATGGTQLPLSPPVSLVAVADVATVGVEGHYDVIYAGGNTLFSLVTQDDQVRCFANVATGLTPGGAFVVEAFVPSFLHRLERQQYVEAEEVEVDRVVLDIARHDPVQQMLEEHRVTLSTEGTRLTPMVSRYAWPAELDLMARLAGLHLDSRFGGWRGEAFTATSERHVSVWRPDTP